MESYEQQSKKIGIIATISIHVVLLLFFIFAVATSPAEPPKLEFGVAVNFGTTEEGFGEQQNYNNPSTNPDNATQKSSIKEEIEKTQFVENKVVTNSEPNKIAKIDDLTSDDKDSPPITKEPVKDTQKEVLKEVSQDISQEKPKPITKPQPINSTTVLEKTTNAGTEDGNSKNGGGNNNGNKVGTVGDMGNPNGDIHADALLGNGGTGGGASLDMSGWVWDEKPVVNDKSAETGKIVFEIKIDDDGEVISVKNIYSTVSRSVANLYEKGVYDLTFSPTSDTGIKANVTTGKIVFIIKSR